MVLCRPGVVVDRGAHGSDLSIRTLPVGSFTEGCLASWRSSRQPSIALDRLVLARVEPQAYWTVQLMFWCG